MKKFVFFLDRCGFFLDCGDRCGFFLDRRSYSPERALFSIRAICSGVMDICCGMDKERKNLKLLSVVFLSVFSVFTLCFLRDYSVFSNSFYFVSTLATATAASSAGIGLHPDSRLAGPSPSRTKTNPRMQKASSAGIGIHPDSRSPAHFPPTQKKTIPARKIPSSLFHHTYPFRNIRIVFSSYSPNPRVLGSFVSLAKNERPRSSILRSALHLAECASCTLLESCSRPKCVRACDT